MGEKTAAVVDVSGPQLSEESDAKSFGSVETHHPVDKISKYIRAGNVEER